MLPQTDPWPSAKRSNSYNRDFYSEAQSRNSLHYSFTPPLHYSIALDSRLGSARVSRAGFGVSPKRTFDLRLRRMPQKGQIDYDYELATASPSNGEHELKYPSALSVGR